MRKIILIALLLISFASLHAQEESIVVEWPEQYYAPYVYMAAYPVYQLAPTAEATGVRFFTLAFVLGGTSCEARWSGTAPLDSSYIYNFLQTDLPALRELGGDVLALFG